jgi:hypothetical protein
VAALPKALGQRKKRSAMHETISPWVPFYAELPQRRSSIRSNESRRSMAVKKSKFSARADFEQSLWEGGESQLQLFSG